MCLSPGARTDDGELNITVIPVKKSKLKMTTELMPKIATGDHVLDPDVEYFPAKGIEVQCDRTAIVDLDGDVVEATRARFTVCPGALRILTPKPSD
jgi:diacylglycerol kinase family enzyme